MGTDLFGIEPDRTFAHGLQQLFERRRFALNPAQGIDARHDEGAQIGTDQATFFELHDYSCNLFFQIEHHRGSPLMIIHRSPEGVIRESLKPAQYGVIGAASEPGHTFITNPKRNQGGFVQIKRKLRFRSGGVFLYQPTINPDDFERALLQVVSLFGVQGQNLPGHVTIGDWADISAFVGVHQFCRIGRHAFVGPYSVVIQDVLPYSTTVGKREIGVFGANRIGLERRGFGTPVIEALQTSLRLLTRAKLNTSQAVERIRAEVTPCAEVEELLEFIRTSERGVVK